MLESASNRATLESEMASRSVAVMGRPSCYQIHLYMPCNQRCIMCVPSGKHPKDFVTFEDFVLFFDAIKDHAEHLTLIGGETLLYPWIDDVVDLLAQHPIAVTIITNATMLDDRLVARLMTLHQLDFKCSMDAATRETYYKIHGTDVFDKVVENVERFARASRGRSGVRQILTYVVMRENFHEVMRFVDFAKSVRPERIEFHPVRHVHKRIAQNSTDWLFDGRIQSCESFKDEFNARMGQIDDYCRRLQLNCETFRLQDA